MWLNLKLWMTFWEWIWGGANLASDSDQRRYSGSEVTNVRYRRPKKLAGGESRFARHVNHGISKPIVATVKATGGGIRREELQREARDGSEGRCWKRAC